MNVIARMGSRNFRLPPEIGWVAMDGFLVFEGLPFVFFRGSAIMVRRVKIVLI